jgi:thiosulfate reductase cytochrome b subunit
MLKSKPIHPWPLRVMHWLNALAIVMMIGSGWQIYNASPLFNFSFPPLLSNTVAIFYLRNGLISESMCHHDSEIADDGCID